MFADSRAPGNSICAPAPQPGGPGVKERCHSERRDATVFPTFAKRTSRPEVEEALWGLTISKQRQDRRGIPRLRDVTRASPAKAKASRRFARNDTGQALWHAIWHTRARGGLSRLHPRKLFSGALYGRYKPPRATCCGTRSETPLRLLEEIQHHAPGVFRGLRRRACRHRQGEATQAVAAR